MKNPDPGYPLPPGEAYTDDFACQLIYIPRNDFYYRAFLGALLYMGTWTAWERDSDKRGKDAAQAWREANELTMECWRMTNCLENITDRMDLIINLLANQPDCCGVTTIGPVITVITNIVPDVGDDPTVWGETEVEDWAEWKEYVCYQAHVYVDTLVESAKALDFATEIGSYTISFLSALIRSLQFLTLGHPVSLSDIMDMYQKFKDAVDLIDAFEGVGDKFEAAREDIVCAIMWGTSLSDAVEDALDDNVLWLLFYFFTDYTAVQALIYEGTADGMGYLAPVRREDCDCGIPEGYSWQGAEEIDPTLNPDTFGRVNTVDVVLPNITVGEKVATSASWGCATYPAGCAPITSANNTYQTLATRYTVISNTGNKDPAYAGNCRDGTPGYRYIYFWTLDEAEGIDDAWAAAQSDDYHVENMGHELKAIGYDWVSGSMEVSDSTPGQTPVYFAMKIEHLVYRTP